MADLTDLQAAQTIKIAGSNTSDIETIYAKVSSNQDIGTADIVDTSGIYGTLTVGTSPVQVKVGGSNLSSRKLITLDNTSNVTLFWGYDNSISTTTYAGRFFKDQQGSWAIGPNVSIWVVAGSAGNSVHISEGA